MRLLLFYHCTRLWRNDKREFNIHYSSYFSINECNGKSNKNCFQQITSNFPNSGIRFLITSLFPEMDDYARTDFTRVIVCPVGPCVFLDYRTSSGITPYCTGKKCFLSTSNRQISSPCGLRVLSGRPHMETKSSCGLLGLCAVSRFNACRGSVIADHVTDRFRLDMRLGKKSNFAVLDHTGPTPLFLKRPCS